MKTEFAKTLARILAERGISQYGLSHRAGMGPETVNRLVNGVRPPNEWQVLRIGIGLTGDIAQVREINRLLDEAGLRVFNEGERYWEEDGIDE